MVSRCLADVCFESHVRSSMGAGKFLSYLDPVHLVSSGSSGITHPVCTNLLEQWVGGKDQGASILPGLPRSLAVMPAQSSVRLLLVLRCPEIPPVLVLALIRDGLLRRVI